MATDNQRLDVAVFIDFENVYVSVRDKLDVNPNFEIIMDRVADLGRVVIARAYADWYRYPRVTSALYANGIEPMYVPTYYYDRDLGRTGRAIKNSVDMNLCIDAMKTLFTNPNIGKFVLATGDRDFIPLVNSIRQQGKEVIIIGVGGAASGHLAQSADEFIFYEQLLGKKPQNLQPDVPRGRAPEKGRDVFEVDETPLTARQRPQTLERAPLPPEPVPAVEPVLTRDEPDVFDTLVQAVHLARERGYVCSFGSLKLLMKELMGGDFKESKYRDAAGRPFAKFKDFALEAERRGRVQVFTSGAVVEVFLPGEDPYKLSQFAQDLKEEPPTSTPETPVHVDARIDGRPVSASRRRRRRRGGSQRPATADVHGALPEDLIDETTEELEYLPPETFGEEVNGSVQVDSMFEELLDRLEAERERQEALASFEMELPDEAQPPVTALPEPVEEPSAISVPVESAAAAPMPDQWPVSETSPGELASHVAHTAPAEETQPFTDDEWQMLRDVVALANRSLSFAQIHDLLREARNNAGVLRTNEELRSLIKQAINSGVLIRSGKGNRISYRLAGADQTMLEGDAGHAEAEAPALIHEPVPPVTELLSDHATVDLPIVTDVGAVAAVAHVEPETPPAIAELPHDTGTMLVAQTDSAPAPTDDGDVPVAAAPVSPKRRTVSRTRKASEDRAGEGAAAMEPAPARASRSRSKSATSGTMDDAAPRPRRRRKSTGETPGEA